MPGVDLDDNAAVRAFLDEGVPLEQRRITADRGFARFPGLRWRHPLAGAG